MIRLVRERSEAAIPASFRGQGRLHTERGLLELKAEGKDAKPSVWKAGKPQLRAESDGKCAYCEGKASHVAFNDVEHFRPKSEYWWLAYSWDNYTFSCQLCNQQFKGSAFPIRGPHLASPAIPANPTPQQLDALVGTLGPDPLDDVAVRAFRKYLRSEKASLPDPYDTGMNPERLFTWFADPVIREVEIRQRGKGARAKAAFAAADEFLGLNRQELKAWRWVVWDVAETLALTLDAPLAPDTRSRVEARLRDMMSLTGEFAGMVRYLVREVRGLSL